MTSKLDVKFGTCDTLKSSTQESLPAILDFEGRGRRLAGPESRSPAWPLLAAARGAPARALLRL